MSGHSKWSSIKHKKAIVDAKRGKIFTKIIREITVSARIGGGDVESNPSLRLAVSKAKDANMPVDNITRAIKKGSGETEGATYEEQLYEGYGPNGVGILIRVLTDNKNRSSADLRAILTKRGASMATQGAVSYLFKRKGFFAISADVISEDDLFMLITDAGAEDLTKEGDTFEVITASENFDSVRKALEQEDIKCLQAELSYIPDILIKISDVETAKKLQSLVEAIEDHDDVQTVYDNSEFPEDIMSQLE